MLDWRTLDMKQVIIFTNCNQTFALEIARVEKIIEYIIPKKVPETAEFLMGVIRYNGKVIPVVDLNRRLYGEAATHDANSKIIVILWNNSLIGLMVHGIIGIRSIEDDMFEASSVGEGRLSGPCIGGFLKIGEDIIILLETSDLFDFEQSKTLIAVGQ